MKAHWEPTTLKLTAKQARVLWELLAFDGSTFRPDKLASLAAIRRKLECQ